MAVYICSNCGYGSFSWIGRCPSCQLWNTFIKQEEQPNKLKKTRTRPATITNLGKINFVESQKIKTAFYEVNRVLGDGFVSNEVILLTGEPGVGKSTLVLQSLANLRILYIAGEENMEQLRYRVEKLSIDLNHFFVTEETQLESIFEAILSMKEKIDIIVVDSIQTIYSQNIDAPAGSITQLKEIISQIIAFAKKEKIPVILIGHITKEGEIAGPKTLEHLVDCVLSFEGERNSSYRLLRALKNRFGPTDEVGIFEMKNGKLIEINNPLIFIEGDENREKIGRAIVGLIQGKRPLFFEIQTLVSPTILSVPRRVVKGLDYNKILLLLAVVKKYLKLPLDRYDIYVNVVGGVDIKSPTADLGFIASIISSFKNLPLPASSLFVGEVGLLGEIRKVAFQEKIISEGQRLGFKKIFSSDKINQINQIAKIFNR
jgi:DNA repair protein RadA/Sms